MKASELQIGDLVLLDNSTPDKIKLIAKYYVVLEENCYCESALDDIKLIPLTEDILKENGFEVLYTRTVLLVEYDGYVILTKNQGDNVYNFASYGHYKIPIMYVHELQKVLRLCGLNDLADNFKVGGKE